MTPAAVPPGRLIGDIQILRGIAIAMVLVEHMPLNLLGWEDGLTRFATRWWAGAMGVDLFFAISGFVIARGLLPLLSAAPTRRAALAVIGRFWLRRAFRLLPAAWLWLAIPVALSAWLPAFGLFGTLRQNLVAAEAGALNIANVVNAGLPYGWPPPPTLIYWSLSLEEQFYLALPLLALLCGRSLPWLLAGALVYQFTVPLTLLADTTRPGALAVGVLLAIAARQPWYARLRPTLLGRSAAVRAVFTLACIAALGRLGILSTSAKLTLVALIAGALVFAASFDGFQIWPDQRSARLLAWLGSRSYAIYLAHMVAFRAIRQVVAYAYGPFTPHAVWLSAVSILAGVPLAVLAGDATCRFVEQPARRLGRRLAAPARAGALATGG